MMLFFTVPSSQEQNWFNGDDVRYKYTRIKLPFKKEKSNSISIFSAFFFPLNRQQRHILLQNKKWFWRMKNTGFNFSKIVSPKGMK